MFLTLPLRNDDEALTGETPLRGYADRAVRYNTPLQRNVACALPAP
jgi:hypothetical protein